MIETVSVPGQCSYFLVYVLSNQEMRLSQKHRPTHIAKQCVTHLFSWPVFHYRWFECNSMYVERQPRTHELICLLNDFFVCWS